MTGIKEKTNKKSVKLTNEQKQIENNLKVLATLKKGGVEHKQANERLLYLLIQAQEPVIKALIRKAKAGDVKAITEVLDRLYGKAKETVDFNTNVKFSLKDLARLREEQLQGKIVDAVVSEESEALSLESGEGEQNVSD